MNRWQGARHVSRNRDGKLFLLKNAMRERTTMRNTIIGTFEYLRPVNQSFTAKEHGDGGGSDGGGARYRIRRNRTNSRHLLFFRHFSCCFFKTWFPDFRSGFSFSTFNTDQKNKVWEVWQKKKRNKQTRLFNRGTESITGIKFVKTFVKSCRSISASYQRGEGLGYRCFKSIQDSFVWLSLSFEYEWGGPQCTTFPTE